MIVVHVMPSLARKYGGPVAALAGYIAAGRVAGVNAIVVGPRPDADDTAWLRETVPGTTLIMTGRPGAGPWTAAPALLRGLLRQLTDADVVHVHGLLNPVSSGAAGVALRRRVPVVIGPFGTMSRYTFGHRRTAAKRLYFRLIDAPNVRRAAAVHFTTSAERDEAGWHEIDFGGRAYVVPPPYRATAVPTGSRGRDAATNSVLFLGRLHPVKGVDILLDAWPAIRAGHPAARLIIAGVGSPGYDATLRARAAALGAHAGSVTFSGFVRGAGKAACLAGAGVCVLPSRHENFGIVVLDAVAAGVPIVVTPGVQLAPWIGAHGMGLVTERTAGAVADAVGRALDDVALRARVEHGGAAAVDADFAPWVVAPALRAMYDAAVAAGNAGPGRSAS